jgi:hypothetical protein
MDLSIFRKDVFSQESNFLFKHSFNIPKFLEIKYKITPEQQKEFYTELIKRNNFNMHISPLVRNEMLLESFTKSCFKKCKQFVLEDWVDFDEIDCTIKCGIKTKESFEILRKTLSQ